MNKFIYKDIINKLANSIQKEDILKNEIRLLSWVIGPMLVIAAMANVFIGILWGMPLYKLLFLAGILILCAFLTFHISKRKKLKSNIKLHIISFIFLVGVSVTYYVYYEKMGVTFWFIMVMITIFANLNSSKILFKYIIGLYVVLYFISVKFYLNNNMKMDLAGYITLLVMLIMVILISRVTNRVYSNIVEKKVVDYRYLIEKNDEVTSLYEEIVASEEELKLQNEKLVFYNGLINNNKKDLEKIAYYDALTGLPNRKMLIDRLDGIIESDIENKLVFSLVFIDLDDFKKINDSLGHVAGDELLVQVAERMSEKIHKKDILGRLGGDELALIIRRDIEGEELFEYVQGMCDQFEQPFNLEGISSKVTASFGIAIYPEDGKSIKELLKAADTAMYKAKEMGKNNVQFYHINMKNEILYKMKMEDSLIRALENEEFYIEYQPLFDTKTKKVIEFEALIRWKNEKGIIISPGEFIPLAEELGLISEVGEWVLDKVCKRLKKFEEKSFDHIKIAVNISALQIKKDSFLKNIKGIIEKNNIDPSRLEFEITESVFIEDKEETINKILELKKMGIQISMDDFGTGYSSLSYLMELPIDKLKIDRAFVKRIEEGSDKGELVRVIIDMVHVLKMKVVAEGIETGFQLGYLEEKSCDLLQGFLLGRPIGEANVDGFVLEKE